MGIDKPMDLKHKCCFQIRRRISFIYLTLKIRKKFDSTNLTFVRLVELIPIYKELFDLMNSTKSRARIAILLPFPVFIVDSRCP